MSNKMRPSFPIFGLKFFCFSVVCLRPGGGGPLFGPFPAGPERGKGKPPAAFRGHFDELFVLAQREAVRIKESRSRGSLKPSGSSPLDFRFPVSIPEKEVSDCPAFPRSGELPSGFRPGEGSLKLSGPFPNRANFRFPVSIPKGSLRLSGLSPIGRTSAFRSSFQSGKTLAARAFFRLFPESAALYFDREIKNFSKIWKKDLTDEWVWCNIMIVIL